MRTSESKELWQIIGLRCGSPPRPPGRGGMPASHRAARQGDSQRIGFNVATLIVAGWTGRDEAALRHHIEELAAIGVPRPSSVPVFYRNSALNVTQASRVEVLGPNTSGEAEPVVV